MIKFITKLFLIVIFFTNFLKADLEKVSLQMAWKHQFEFAGFYAAIEKGYYKDIGLEVELKEYQTGMDVTQEIIDKKSTFGTTSTSLILERLKNKPVVLLASYFKQNALVLVVKSDIKTPHDLKNKKIMVADYQLEKSSLAAMLKDVGLTKNDYTAIEHEYKVDKFASGEVDAISIFLTSEFYELIQSGVEFNILNPANYGIYSYDTELFTSVDIANKNPKMVEDFIEATNKGWEYAFKNKEEIVDLIYEKYSNKKSKESLLYEAIQIEHIFKTNVFKIGAVIPELIKLNADVFVNLGLIDKNKNLTNLFNDSYFFNNLKKSIFTASELQYLRNHSTLKVQNEPNKIPLNFNENGKESGFSVDYMNLLASKIGLKIEYVKDYNSRQYLEMLKNNEIDILLNIPKTANTEKYFKFTTPYLKSIDTVFVKSNVHNLNSLDNFEGKKLAILKGFYEEELLKIFYPKMEFIYVENSIEGLKKVIFNEADGFIDNLLVANYYIKSNFIKDIKPAFEIEDKNFSLDLSLAVNKSNKELMNILEKGKNLISEDELIELKKKWIDIESNTNMIALKLSNKEKNYLNSKKIINVCANTNLKPYEYLNEFKEHKGIFSNYIDLISKNLDLKVEFIHVENEDKKYEFAKNNLCDIFITRYEESKKNDWLEYSDSIFNIPDVLIARNDFEDIEDLTKLKDKTIAIPKDSHLYEYIKHEYPNLKIVNVDNFEDAFYLVQNKAADMTTHSLVSAAYIIKKDNIFNLKIVSENIIHEDKFKIAVLKNDITLLEILNKAIKKITKKEQESIINEYISIKLPENYKYIKLFLYALFSTLFITFIIIFWNYQLRKKIQAEIKKNSEQQNIMFQQNKQAELGNLIANISHQWRDSLTKIGYINLNLRARILHNKEIPNELLNTSTLQIEKSLDFMSETMQNFLDYYKPSSNISEFDAYDSINSALSIIDTQIKNNGLNIEFKGDFSVKINGIRNEWMQVWINIIINAINISTKREISNPNIEITIKNDEIVFEDNCGKIDNEILEKLIDKNYFGLGIKMANEIALKNNKKMIISNSSKGAKFKFIEV